MNITLHLSAEVLLFGNVYRYTLHLVVDKVFRFNVFCTAAHVYCFVTVTAGLVTSLVRTYYLILVGYKSYQME